MKRLLIKAIGFGIVLIVLVFIIGRFSLVFAGNPPDPLNSTLVATSPGSDEVPADGVTTASLTLTLQDSSGTPLAGDTVSLSAPGDGTAVFSPTSTTLDGSGTAVFTVTSTTVGTDDITVTDETTATDLVAFGQVIFDAVPTPTDTPTPTPTPTLTPTDTPTPTSTQSNSNNSSNSSSSSSCSSTYPTDAPNLYQVSVSSGSAYLWFVEPTSQFDGYTISYGLTSSADSYNYTFTQARVGAALEYTINDLTVGSIYYFKIRANNGCAPGPWSNTLNSNNSIATLGGGTLLAAGPGNLIMGIGIGGIGLAAVGLFAILFVL